MVRVAGGAPAIDPTQVKDFFDRVSAGAKVEDNYAVTVFANRELANARHEFEKKLAFELLRLPEATANVIEFGCGGGRWAESLLINCDHPIFRYFGIDFSSSLIDLANKLNLGSAARFENISVENFCAFSAGTEPEYSHALAIAVAIYMNDSIVSEMYRTAFNLLIKGGLLYVREGVSLNENRLTLIEEQSITIGDSYNAIYRTVDEYKNLLRNSGFEIVRSGPLENPHFSRHNTTQHYYFYCRKI